MARRAIVSNERNEQEAIFGKKLSFQAAEAYRLLRTNLLFSLPSSSDRKCRVIGVTSANLGEGKSTTALNLAYMLAEAHKQVVLVEADMRLPTISKRLGLNLTPGLSNLLAGMSTGQRVVQNSGIEERLQVIPAGDPPPNPSELLGFSGLKAVIEILAQTSDFIIFDLPPIEEVADALVVSHLMDGMLMVVRQDYASRRAVANAMRQLEHANAKILGFVLNGAGTPGKGKYKSSYGYRRSYGYGEQKPQE